MLRVPLLAVILCCTALAADRLTVDGDVAAPLTLTVAELAKMPRETVSPDYEGVLLTEVLKRAGIQFGPEMRGKALAGYVLAEAHDGYQVVFSLGELDPELGSTHVIVADRRDGKPLEAEQGPIRLVVSSDKRPARSVRMLERLHVVRLKL